MTLIKQEKVVFTLVILYIREYLHVFIKLFTGTRVSEDFQFRVSGSRNNQKPYNPNPHLVFSKHPAKCNRMQCS